MKNNTNIYDIDGELIRKSGDNHHITLEEARKKVEYYRNKLEKLDKTDKKAAVYETYIRNLNAYIFNLYSKMSHDELITELNSILPQNTTSEQVENALDELKKEVETPEKETVMDEYVPFEEVNE